MCHTTADGGGAAQLQLLLLIKRAKLEKRTLRSNCGLLLMSAHRWPNGQMAEWQNGKMAKWQNGRMAPLPPPIAVIITLPLDRWPTHYATHFPISPDLLDFSTPIPHRATANFNSISKR